METYTLIVLTLAATIRVATPLLRSYRWCCHTPADPSQEIDMTTDQRIARRKLSLLELAQEAPSSQPLRGRRVVRAGALVGPVHQPPQEVVEGPHTRRLLLWADA